MPLQTRHAKGGGGSKDLVNWFLRHPYLNTSKPESVTVGGVKGKEIDMVLQAPEDYYGQCGSADCMDVWMLGTGEET